MANSKECKGYDVKLVSSFPARYRCPLCKLLLRDAVQTFRGELACEECYQTARSVNPSVCPIDGEQIDDSEIFQDKHARRQILQLACYCNNKENGCPWEGTVQEVENHIGKCDYKQVQCGACKEALFMKDLKHHLASQCMMRVTKCPFCLRDFIARDLKEHSSNCSKKPHQCPYGCETPLIQSYMYEHVKNCPSLTTATVCPYKSLGCQEKVNGKKSLETHMHVDSLYHVTLSLEAVKNVKDEGEALRKQLDQEIAMRNELEKKIEKQAIEHVPVKEDVAKLQEKFWSLEKSFEVSREEVESRTSKLWDDVKRQSERSPEELMKPIQETCQRLNVKYEEFAIPEELMKPIQETCQGLNVKYEEFAIRLKDASASAARGESVSSFRS